MYAGSVAGPDRPPDQPGEGTAGGYRGASSLPATLAARVEEIVRAAEQEASAIQHDIEEHRRFAEDEAQRYLDDAKRQAEALVQRRIQRVREVSDELLERAELTKRHFDSLIATLERATLRLERDDLGEGRAQPFSPSRPEGEPPRRPGAPPPVAPAADRPGRPELDFPEPPSALRAAIRAPGELGLPGRQVGPPLSGAASSEGREQSAPRSESLPSQAPPGEDPFEPAPAANLEAARLVAIEMAVAGRTRDEVDTHLRDSFRITNTRDMLDDVFGGGASGSARTSWAQS